MAPKKGQSVSTPKRGPNGWFLPKTHKGSHFGKGGKAYDSKGREIPRAKALSNFKRSARTNPFLKQYLPTKLPHKRAKLGRRRRKFGYKKGHYSIKTMEPGRRYMILADVLVPAKIAYHGRGPEVRTYSVGVYTPEQLLALSREDLEAIVYRIQPLTLEILGFWRRPAPQLRRKGRHK